MNKYINVTNAKIQTLVALLLMVLGSLSADAQRAAVKTNLLYDLATLTVNAGAEAKLAPRWTLELTGNINAWPVNGRRMKQWSLQPEARYWFCDPFTRHFAGFHLIGGQYNFGNLPLNFKFLGTDFSQLRDYRFQGWMGGAGIAYGYNWIIDRHWNIEAEIGAGWIYTRYDKYNCFNCGKKVESDVPHNYFGPTKAAINLVYLF